MKLFNAFLCDSMVEEKATTDDEEEEKKKLLGEISILKQLDHPNILKLYEFF